MATAGALSGRIAGEEGWRNWTALHVGPREIGFDDWVLTSHDVIAFWTWRPGTGRWNPHSYQGLFDGRSWIG